MKLEIKGKEIVFTKVPIKFLDDGSYTENMFQHYSKSNLQRTYSKKRFNSLRLKHAGKYDAHFEKPIGEFILELKKQGDPEYRKFLNKYGDEKFCNYKIESFQKDKGLYCYILNGEIKYVGRCLTNFNSRINNDYGKITAYNCLLDGQATNCHLNSILNIFRNETIEIGIYCMKDNAEIKRLETHIISSELILDWNIQLQKDKRPAANSG